MTLRLIRAPRPPGRRWLTLYQTTRPSILHLQTFAAPLFPVRQGRPACQSALQNSSCCTITAGEPRLSFLQVRAVVGGNKYLLVQLVPHFLFICPRIVCRRIYLALDLGLQRSPQQCILQGAAQCGTHTVSTTDRTHCKDLPGECFFAAQRQPQTSGSRLEGASSVLPAGLWWERLGGHCKRYTMRCLAHAPGCYVHVHAPRYTDGMPTHSGGARMVCR